MHVSFQAMKNWNRPPRLLTLHHPFRAWTIRTQDSLLSSLMLLHCLIVLMNSTSYPKRFLPSQITWLFNTEICGIPIKSSTESINRLCVPCDSLNSHFYQFWTVASQPWKTHLNPHFKFSTKSDVTSPTTSTKLCGVVLFITVVTNKLSFVLTTGCVEDIWGASIRHHQGPLIFHYKIRYWFTIAGQE